MEEVELWETKSRKRKSHCAVTRFPRAWIYWGYFRCLAPFLNVLWKSDIFFARSADLESQWEGASLWARFAMPRWAALYEGVHDMGVA
jgi:hypothetical protein